MELRLIAGMALVAGSLIVGCGGDDDDGDGGGDGGGDPVACIEDAGLTATSAPGDEALGSTEQITVALPDNNQILVTSFEDESAAEDYAEGESAFLEGAGAGGSSEVVGSSVVGVAREGAEDEVETVKGCLG
ncbi:MAG: hypothetical protein ACRDL6_00655 [Solirubrobacterales bacterium]